MAYYPRIRNESDSLQHFGILGQKWGKRNGPPYPLNSGSRSSTEKLKAKAEYGSSSASANKGSRHTSAYTTNKSNYHLSDKQKKKAIKIGAGVVVGSAVLGIAVYELHKHPELLSKGMGYVQSINGLDDKNLKRIGESRIIIDSDKELKQFASNINSSKSTVNCGSCSSAVLAKMNGINAEALAEPPEHMRKGRGYDPNKIAECYSGAKIEHVSGMNRRTLSEKVESTLLSYGDGAYGYLYPEQLRGFDHGHYFAFTIQNGTVKILEGQVPTAQDGIVWSGHLIDTVGNSFNPNAEVGIIRIDGCPIIPGKEKDLYRVKK